MTVYAKALLIIAAIYFAVMVLMFVFQRRLLYVPHKRLRTPHMDILPEMQEIKLKTADNLKLKSYYIPPKNNAEGKPYPTVLYLHGNTGTAKDSAHNIIPIANAGFGILLLEYRGFGGNPGFPTEIGLITDAKAALKFIRDQHEQEVRYVYYGVSMGTGVANGLAVERPPDAFIQEAGFTSIIDAARQWYWFLPLSFLIKDTFLSYERIKSLTTPLLILHGEKDRTVSIKQGKLIYKLAGSRDKEMKVYPEGHHIDLYDYGAAEDIVEWLHRKFPDTAE